MINNYIVNGKVERNKIVMDIKYRKLTGTGIVELCNDPRVREAFFGSGHVDKRPKTEWNEDYLVRLSYAVVGEVFDRDYLLYLDEVADFVSKNNFRKKTGRFIPVLVIVFIIIVGIVVCKCATRGI